MILYQPQNGYCYNSDTHFLFSFITKNLKNFKNIQGKLLDIGSGSGILGLLMARDYCKLELTQIEIQESFAFLSVQNAKINNIKSTMLNIDFCTMNTDVKYDIIISNPPFYPSSVVQSTNENKKIARYNDNMPLKDFLSKVNDILDENGKFFFCYDVQLLNDIMIYSSKLKLNIISIEFLYPNENKEASLVMIMIRKNSKTLMKVMKPIIMFKNNGEYTNNTNDVYKLCDTHSIKCVV